MTHRAWSVLCSLAVVSLLLGCQPDSDGPPYPGGPPKDPDSISRSGGNGPKGLNHRLLVLGVVPAEGPVHGGTDVIVVGFNFKQDGPITEVLFDQDPVPTFDVRSNNQIDAVTPPHVAGRVGITVRNADGNESTRADIFEYIALPPDCVRLDPTAGPDTGGTPVTIETSGFQDDFTVSLPFVYFDTAPATSLTAIDASTLLVTSPPDPNPFPPPNLHPVDVTVETGTGETCVFPQGFTYVGPTAPPCMYITPPGGPVAGGNTVTILSMGACQWTPNTTVTFGGVPATQITSISATQLDAVVPPARPGQQGPVDVEVTGVTPSNPCTCILPNGYTYY